ncbi:MAG: hypothetical protein Kow0022_05140 [Phycisphaerales bacterium]
MAQSELRRSVLAPGLLLLALLAGMSGRGVHGQEASLPRAEPAQVSLAEVMESLKGHLKFIAQHLSDPADRSAVLEHVHDMQRLVWIAKTLTPDSVAALPEPERTARQLAFRRRLDEVLMECCRLEIHVIDGRAADAWNVIRGPLLKLREEGHRQFQDEDDQAPPSD